MAFRDTTTSIEADSKALAIGATHYQNFYVKYRGSVDLFSRAYFTPDGWEIATWSVDLESFNILRRQVSDEWKSAWVGDNGEHRTGLLKLRGIGLQNDAV